MCRADRGASPSAERAQSRASSGGPPSPCAANWRADAEAAEEALGAVQESVGAAASATSSPHQLGRVEGSGEAPLLWLVAWGASEGGSCGALVQGIEDSRVTLIRIPARGMSVFSYSSVYVIDPSGI